MSFSVKALDFSYGRKPALQDVTFKDVPRGGLTVLIGPNAAGKSTLFRCVAGLLKTGPDTVFLDGEDLHRIDRARRSRMVCFMPQSIASNAALTVFEVVLLARKHLLGWRVGDDDAAAVERLLQRLGIEQLADCYIGELSGGQQQMVSVCQALVREPSLYLLDEPTSALDLRHQLEVMEAVKAVTAERNAVTVVALHDLNLAARFADHLLLMRDGRIAATGPPETMLTSPQLGEAYGVNIDLARTGDGSLVVAARL